MADTILLGLQILFLVSYISCQGGVRMSFSSKSNGNPRFSGNPGRQVRFSGKSSSQVFSVKSAFKHNNPSILIGTKSSRASTNTNTPYRRQYPSIGANSFLKRREQTMKTNPPYRAKKQQKSPAPMQIKWNSGRSPTNNFRLSMKQQQFSKSQRRVEPINNNRRVINEQGIPTFQPNLQQFVQPFQFKKEPIKTTPPPVNAIHRFTPSSYSFDAVKKPPSYKFDLSLPPRRSSSKRNQILNISKKQNIPQNPSQSQKMNVFGGNAQPSKSKPELSQRYKGMQFNRRQNKKVVLSEPLRQNSNSMMINKPQQGSNVMLNNNNMNRNTLPLQRGGNNRLNGRPQSGNRRNNRRRQRRRQRQRQQQQQKMQQQQQRVQPQKQLFQQQQQQQQYPLQQRNINLNHNRMMPNRGWVDPQPIMTTQSPFNQPLPYQSSQQQPFNNPNAPNGPGYNFPNAPFINNKPPPPQLPNNPNPNVQPPRPGFPPNPPSPPYNPNAQPPRPGFPSNHLPPPYNPNVQPPRPGFPPTPPPPPYNPNAQPPRPGFPPTPPPPPYNPNAQPPRPGLPQPLPTPYAPKIPPSPSPHPRPTSFQPSIPSTAPLTTPTKKPTPLTTLPINGIGDICKHTAECSAGCCFDKNGTMLDTDTYGPGSNKIGLVTGFCRMIQPGLGDICDDLCACDKGLICYRRYKTNYKEGELMALDTTYEPPPPPSKPRRTCVRKAVAMAERFYFWKCYFDTACSGPLLR